MISAITIDRRAPRPKYGEVLDVLEVLSHTFGSATNAAVQCILDSPIYQQAAKEMGCSEDQEQQEKPSAA